MKVRRDDNGWHVYVGHRLADVILATGRAGFVIARRWRAVWLGYGQVVAILVYLGLLWWSGIPANHVAAVGWWFVALLWLAWPPTPAKERRAAQYRAAWSWLRGWKSGPTTIIDAITIRDMSFGPGGLEVTGAVDTHRPERIRVRRGPMFGQPRPSAGAWRIRRARRG